MTEHEVKETLHEDVYYPAHEPRTESVTFAATKKEGHEKGYVCCICGAPDPEYHHAMVEWAFTDLLDWAQIKAVALGQTPIETPHGAVKVDFLLLYWLLRLAEIRGFDWHSFDPTHPETFVDSMSQMLPLCAEHHRAVERGVHMAPFPDWVLQAFPKKAGEHEFSQETQE